MSLEADSCALAKASVVSGALETARGDKRVAIRNVQPSVAAVRGFYVLDLVDRSAANSACASAISGT